MLRKPASKPTRMLARAIGVVAIAALGLAAALALPSVAGAANVSGILTGHDGQAQADRQIHFEGRVTHDLFLVQTGPDGKFSTDLPPGTYSLRGERGSIIVSGIAVRETDLALGKVSEPRTMTLLRWFDGQGVTKGIVTMSAPATANIPAIEQPPEVPGSPPSPAK